MKTRKELKEEYKHLKFRMGVFAIRNLTNGKVFISSSLDLKAIWHAQKLQLDMGIHPNGALQADWNALGADNFSYEILDELKETEGKELDYKKEIKTLEEMHIDSMQPFGEKGYNALPGRGRLETKKE